MVITRRAAGPVASYPAAVMVDPPVELNADIIVKRIASVPYRFRHWLQVSGRERGQRFDLRLFHERVAENIPDAVLDHRELEIPVRRNAGAVVIDAKV